jgi:membrane associated rhomboid family serine protease
MLPLRDHLPTRSFPVVNYALMALNVVVFGVEAWLAGGSSGPSSLDEWALVPARLVAHPMASAPTLLTHMFLRVLYPRSPITVVNPIPLLWIFWGLFISLPAWFVILEFFAANLWNAFQPSSAPGGVAFVAHVGGFLAGLALLPLLRTQEPVDYDPWERWLPLRGSR